MTFFQCRESQTETQAILQAETQTKHFLLNCAAVALVARVLHHRLELQRGQVGAHGERQRARRGRHRQGRDLRQRGESTAAQVHLLVRPGAANHHVNIRILESCVDNREGLFLQRPSIGEYLIYRDAYA